MQRQRRTSSIAVRVLVAALALVGVAGCGSGPTSGTHPSAGPPSGARTASPAGRPDALIGLWRVAGAKDEPAGTVLRLSAGDSFDVIVFRHCGQLLGSWTAGTGGTFIANITGLSGPCPLPSTENMDAPAWLAQARGFRVRGEVLELVASDGAVLARLLPGAKVTPVSDLAASEQQTPTPSPANVRKLLATPAPLPAGATAATASTLLGRWVPYPVRAYANGSGPYVTFAPDGTWTASDGCNGSGGPWAISGAGELLTVSGPSTLIGCDGAPTTGWVADARRAAIAGDILTLYGVDGHVTGRLTR